MASAAAPPRYETVRLVATVPVRKHLWDVGRFWPTWEEASDNSLRQLGQPRKPKKELARAVLEGRSASLGLPPVDLLAEYVLFNEYLPEKGALRLDEHILDDSFRALTHGLLYRDAPSLPSTHSAAAERIFAHAERRFFVRSRQFEPLLDPLGLMLRLVVAGGSAPLVSAAAARDAHTGHVNGRVSTAGSDPAAFALCLAVGYDAMGGSYTVWVPATLRYESLSDEAAAAAPSPLVSQPRPTGTWVSVEATMVRMHDVRANMFRSYFKGQQVLARRLLDGADAHARVMAAEGGTLSSRLMRLRWSTTWHEAEVVGSEKTDLKVMMIRYLSDGPDATAVPVVKCDVTLAPVMGEPTEDELKALRKAHKRRAEAKLAGKPEVPLPPPPGLAAIKAAVEAGRARARAAAASGARASDGSSASGAAHEEVGIIRAEGAVGAGVVLKPEAPGMEAKSEPVSVKAEGIGVAVRHGPPTEAALAQLAASRGVTDMRAERAAKTEEAVAAAVGAAREAEAEAKGKEQVAEAELARMQTEAEASRARAIAEAEAEAEAAEADLREWEAERAAKALAKKAADALASGGSQEIEGRAPAGKAENPNQAAGAATVSEVAAASRTVDESSESVGRSMEVAEAKKVVAAATIEAAAATKAAMMAAAKAKQDEEVEGPPPILAPPSPQREEIEAKLRLWRVLVGLPPAPMSIGPQAGADGGCHDVVGVSGASRDALEARPTAQAGSAAVLFPYCARGDQDMHTEETLEGPSTELAGVNGAKITAPLSLRDTEALPVRFSLKRRKLATPKLAAS